MERRRLGTGGPQVAPVGLGCMSFGGIYGATDVAESHRTLDRAIERGIDHLDTADVYGEGVSEEGYINQFTNAAAEPFGARSGEDLDARLAGQRSGATDLNELRAFLAELLDPIEDEGLNDTLTGVIEGWLLAS